MKGLVLRHSINDQCSKRMSFSFMFHDLSILFFRRGYGWLLLDSLQHLAPCLLKYGGFTSSLPTLNYGKRLESVSVKFKSECLEISSILLKALGQTPKFRFKFGQFALRNAKTTVLTFLEFEIKGYLAETSYIRFLLYLEKLFMNAKWENRFFDFRREIKILLDIYKHSLLIAIRSGLVGQPYLQLDFV